MVHGPPQCRPSGRPTASAGEERRGAWPHLVEPPAVQQGGQLVQASLRGVEQVLDALEVALGQDTTCPVTAGGQGHRSTCMFECKQHTFFFFVIVRECACVRLHECVCRHICVRALLYVCVCVCLYVCLYVCMCVSTSAEGKRGTANCSRPWIWICMVVRDL